jgi:chromate transporter
LAQGKFAVIGCAIRRKIILRRNRQAASALPDMLRHPCNEYVKRVTEDDQQTARSGGRSATQIFLAFLRLGLTSFGGPVAHLGYFRTLFVARKRWLTDSNFVDLVGLCQFLPGPASSQVAFGIGMLEAGWWGGLVAWFAFTLPSAVLMILFAEFAARFGGALETAILHGLKVVAVAVVAHAVLSMARSLTPDFRRMAIAAMAALLVLVLTFPMAQPMVIAVGALAGLAICRDGAAGAQGLLPPTMPACAAAAMLAAFALLLIGLPFAAPLSPGLWLFNAFYRTGALVFGGGHVVLPLLQNAVVAPGLVSTSAFLAGYGAAQALPGPLFSIAAYLGAIAGTPPGGVAGAVIALAGISLPGLLLVAGILPFWDRLRGETNVRAAVRGINAAVVGILAAALYMPLWTSAIADAPDVMLAATGLVLLMWTRVPVLAVVALITVAETALAFLG